MVKTRSRKRPAKTETENQDKLPAQDLKQRKQPKTSSKNGISSISKFMTESNKTIVGKFLVEMPEDFYHFWDYCKMVSADNPQNVLKQPLDLVLAGPYDVLLGNLDNVEDCVCHDRFLFDVPEFQTVMKSTDNSKFHIGYFRDDPKENPVFVASNTESKGCTIEPLSPTIFSAIISLIDSKKKSSPKSHDSLISLKESIESFASDRGINVNSKIDKQRKEKVSAKAFHGAGIVVPLGSNGLGYRPIPESYAEQRAIFKKITNSKSDEERKVQFQDMEHIISNIQFANDECDFGMGLEFSINLFCTGSDAFNSVLMHLMPMAYKLLNRPEFATIAERILQKKMKK